MLPLLIAVYTQRVRLIIDCRRSQPGEGQESEPKYYESNSPFFHGTTPTLPVPAREATGDVPVSALSGLCIPGPGYDRHEPLFPPAAFLCSALLSLGNIMHP